MWRAWCLLGLGQLGDLLGIARLDLGFGDSFDHHGLDIAVAQRLGGVVGEAVLEYVRLIDASLARERREQALIDQDVNENRGAKLVGHLLKLGAQALGGDRQLLGGDVLAIHRRDHVRHLGRQLGRGRGGRRLGDSGAVREHEQRSRR